MAWPRNYPGECSMPVKTGQTVEASHFQTIFDWMRWYVNWFVPPHVYESACQGTNQGSAYSRGSSTFTVGHRKIDMPGNKASLLCQYNPSAGLDFGWWGGDGSSSYYNTYFTSVPQDGTLPPIYKTGATFTQFKVLKYEWKVMAFFDLWGDAFIL